jgi:hypothetical protein
MTSAVAFEVVHSQWAAEDEVFAGGTHTVEDPSAAFLSLLAAAASSGSVLLPPEHAAIVDEHVQSQADGEAALAAAMGEWISPGRWSGEWHEANLAQFALDVESGQRLPTLEAPEESA